MKKLLTIGCLALGLLLCACARLDINLFQPRVTEKTTTACTEAPTTTEALPDAGLRGVVLSAPETLTVTPETPAAEFTLTATGVCPDGAPEGGRHCTVKLSRDGTVIETVEDFVLTEGATLDFSVDYPFGRYLPQEDSTLIAELDYGDEYRFATIHVTVQGYPDEYYAMTSADPYPYAITIFVNKNVVAVYGRDDKGEYTCPVKLFICSTGPCTPTKGTYSLLRKYDWRALIHGLWGQYATWITGNILIHSVPYHSKNKDDLWSWQYNRLGASVSTGCIRMRVCDCKWIFDYCPCGTPVTFLTVNELPEGIEVPAYELLDLESENAGWDPTDPDPANPWKPEQPDESWKAFVPDCDEILTANTTLDRTGYEKYIETSARFTEPAEAESEEP